MRGGRELQGYLPCSHEGRPAKIYPDGRVIVTDEFGGERKAEIKPMPRTLARIERWHNPYE